MKKEASAWNEEIAYLNRIMQNSGLEHSIKWGIDVYTHEGSNVVGICGFKNYVGIWFYNGVFMSDPAGKFINAQENKTKALRQWRFANMQEIDESLILAYIKEAIQNEKEGKKWIPEKITDLEINGLLAEEIEKDKNFKDSFEKLSLSKQKEYLEHVNGAKKEVTQKARLEKVKPLILEGKGLNDKYLKK
ncbi:YdeI/OmpD-associated family protein [Arthrospiribacter ruber]|uniref:YdhG-like domain-containing protein n=1 Tax=Arthrospiribacter ruber TaxID=2487934 RepID=A0A951IZE9_9BACT|nr:DUF1801 domain-containing protein [Arthrospiribacter ruber]MBW3468647.1 hypothetical protein [Arthrospiribacter ruber]